MSKLACLCRPRCFCVGRGGAFVGRRRLCRPRGFCVPTVPLHPDVASTSSIFQSHSCSTLVALAKKCSNGRRTLGLGIHTFYSLANLSITYQYRSYLPYQCYIGTSGLTMHLANAHCHCNVAPGFAQCLEALNQFLLLAGDL